VTEWAKRWQGIALQGGDAQIPVIFVGPFHVVVTDENGQDGVRFVRASGLLPSGKEVEGKQEFLLP
jgi:hypothetical protein